MKTGECDAAKYKAPALPEKTKKAPYERMERGVSVTAAFYVHDRFTAKTMAVDGAATI